MIQETTQSEEQIKQDNQSRESLHSKLKDSLLSGDILQGIGDSAPEPEKAPVKKQVDILKEAVEEPQEVVQEEVEEQSEEEADEEVVPKSKIQPRIDKLTATIKALEAQVEELRSKSVTETKDEVTKQLETMNQDQLKQAKLNVRRELLKSQDDDARMNELLALEDKIDDAIRTTPQRFEKAQVEQYNRKVREIEMSGRVPDLEKAAPAILQIAKEIYSTYPKLQQDVDGQAMALELAVKHHLALSGSGVDRSKEAELKRQVNTLKKKTTLDTKSSQANVEKANIDRLRKEANNGSMRSKLNLIKNDPSFLVDKMIPDDFKER